MVIAYVFEHSMGTGFGYSTEWPDVESFVASPHNGQVLPIGEFANERDAHLFVYWLHDKVYG